MKGQSNQADFFGFVLISGVELIQFDIILADFSGLFCEILVTFSIRMLSSTRVTADWGLRVELDDLHVGDDFGLLPEFMYSQKHKMSSDRGFLPHLSLLV